jgi:hypothetical protein
MRRLLTALGVRFPSRKEWRRRPTRRWSGFPFRSCAQWALPCSAARSPLPWRSRFQLRRIILAHKRRCQNLRQHSFGSVSSELPRASPPGSMEVWRRFRMPAHPKLAQAWSHTPRGIKRRPLFERPATARAKSYVGKYAMLPQQQSQGAASGQIWPKHRQARMAASYARDSAAISALARFRLASGLRQ